MQINAPTANIRRRFSLVCLLNIMLNIVKKITFKKVFISILFVSIAIGEVLYSFYSYSQSGINSIKKERDQAIDKFLNSSESIDRYKSMQRDIAQLDASTDAKQQQNESALAQSLGKKVINTFDDKIRADKTAKQEIIDKYDAWKKEKTDAIKADYQPKIEAASGLSSNVYMSLTVSLIAMSLAFFATQQDDFWRWVLLAGSFVAQCYISKVIYGGTLLRNGSVMDAWFAALVFFLCVPLSYHFGLICFNTNISMSGITFSQTKHGTSVTVWSKDAGGWEKAILTLAKERANNNGKGLMTEIARDFHVNKGQVYRAWKNVLDGKPLYVPKKLLETN